MATVTTLSNRASALLPRGLARERPSAFLNAVARFGAPEAPLFVEFVGLTESEQRAAINGFPGGQRFVLGTPRTH